MKVVELVQHLMEGDTICGEDNQEHGSATWNNGPGRIEQYLEFPATNVPHFLPEVSTV